MYEKEERDNGEEEREGEGEKRRKKGLKEMADEREEMEMGS